MVTSSELGVASQHGGNQWGESFARQLEKKRRSRAARFYGIPPNSSYLLMMMMTVLVEMVTTSPSKS